VRRVRYTPDGKYILSGGRDSRMIVWDAATYELVRIFREDNPDTEEIEGHSDDIRDIDFSPIDPNLVVTSSDDDTLILWDFAAGEIIWQTPKDDPETEEYEGNADNVRESAISPDGRYVANVGYDFNVYLWDMADGTLVRTFFGHTDKVSSIAYSPDGTRIVSGGGGDHQIRVWDVETGEELMLLEGHDGWVKGLKLSPDGRLMLTSSDDNSVKLWDLDRGVELFTFNGHTAFVEEASFSPDGKHIISSSGDETLRIWDIQNGAEIERLWGHTSTVEKVAISPDGTFALSGAQDSTVRIWDLSTGEQIGQFDGHVPFVKYTTVLAISPDGTLALSGDNSGVEDDDPENIHLWLWNIESGEIVQDLKGHTWFPWSAAFHPNGKWVATGSRDESIIIWDIETGEIVRQLDKKVEEGSDEPDYIKYYISALAFNSDGTLLFSGGDTVDPTLVLWDLSSDDPAEWGKADVDVEQVSGSGVAMVAFSPDDSQLMVASKDTFIYILDAATGQLVQKLEGHTESLRGAFYSTDGSQIISYAEDRTIRVWDIATALPVYQITVDSEVLALDITPDRTGMLTGGEDTIVRLWDITPRSLDDLVQWTQNNRYVPELSCRQRDIYKVTPCDEAVPTSE
jgi:WD40 repeat protein